MRRITSVVLVLVIALALVAPNVAAAPVRDRDEIKLHIFVHYPKNAKPGAPLVTCDPTEITSSAYLPAGWHLPSSVTYQVNYDTIPSTVTDAKAAIASSFAVWDASTGSVAFHEGPPTSVTRYKRDGQNVVIWGSVPSGAIAVTYTWYNSVTGLVVESDTVMGKRLPWKNNTGINSPDTQCGDPGYYDLQNILVHEIGHWMGLKDLYTSPEHDLTMYGYGSLGEVKKRTLMKGDSDGINAIY